MGDAGAGNKREFVFWTRGISENGEWLFLTISVAHGEVEAALLWA